MNKKIAIAAGIALLLAGAFAFTLLRGQQETPAAPETSLIIEEEEKTPVPVQTESPAQNTIQSTATETTVSASHAPSTALSFTGTSPIDTDAITEQAKEAQAMVEQALADAREQAAALGEEAQAKIEAISEQAQQEVQQALETAKEQGSAIAEQAATSVEAAKEQAQTYSKEAQEQAQAAINNAKEQAQEALNERKEAATAVFGSTLSGLSGKTGGLSTQIAKKALNEKGSYSSKNDVALYLYIYGHLPQNFITKTEARKLGWTGGGLEAYAPGKSIGGDSFGNREGKLPAKAGRTYTECDIDTKGKDSRGAKRIVFSSDGLIYYTGDHYESFELLYDRNN